MKNTALQCLGAVIAALVVAMVLFVIFPPKARADVPEKTFNCQALAVNLEFAAELRDLGVRLDKALAYIKLKSEEQGARWDAVDREVRRIWAQRLTSEEVLLDVYTRCTLQLGDMGREG